MTLNHRCEVCKAKPGQPCVNTINPSLPLPGRGEHLARVLPPGRATKAEGLSDGFRGRE